MSLTETLPPDKVIGTPAEPRRGSWVQTERKGHEAWSQLVLKLPRAAALLHILVSRMGERNAVVIPQKLLAKMMGIHDRTVQRGIADLVAGKWIQVVRLNGPGTVCAYVINDRVAWGQPREQLCLSMFSATVVADICDQDDLQLDIGELRKIPIIYQAKEELKEAYQ
jgi:Helix-turn-helix domain